MEALFFKVLNMSLTASYVILAVLVMRMMLCRAPKKYAYALWSVVGFRLCCPVSFQSIFSLFTLAGAPAKTGGVTMQYVPQELGAMAQPEIHTGLAAANSVINDMLPAATPQSSANPMQIWISIGIAIWCLGMAVLLIYSIVRYAMLRRRLRYAVLHNRNIYQAEQIPSPFILGLIRPKIYVPFGLDPSTMQYVLAHENYHLTHRDHLVKAFAFLLLTVYWFNPLCYLAFWLMGKDMEMRCDEAVLSQQNSSCKAYSRCLLCFAANRRFPTPSPLAFGETGAKSRIKNALRWKKPKLWLTILAAAICIAGIIGCAANPAGLRLDLAGNPIVSAQTLDLRQSSEPLEYQLSQAQLDELTSRLQDVNAAAGDDYAGLTPMYFLCAQLHDGSQIKISGYDLSGDMTEIAYEERRYAVADEDFCSYLSRVCSGGDQTAATLLPQSTCYTAVECLYQNPLSSTLVLGDPGLQLSVREDAFTLCNTQTGQIIASASMQEFSWQNLTPTMQVWEKLAQINTPDISHFEKPQIMVLSDQYTLADMDGEIWLLEIRGDFLWHIYLMSFQSGRALTGGADGPAYVQTTPEQTTLDGAIATAIAQANHTPDAANAFFCQNYVLLGTQTSSAAQSQTNAQTQVVAYLIALCQTYTWNGQTLQEVGGSHMPSALTFSISPDGTYHLEEYWRPQDGNLYESSIRKKFPDDLEDAALDTQSHLLTQMQSCYAQAVEHYSIDTDTVIARLFDLIEVSPAHSSNPGDYLDAHQLEYRQLLYYGDFTLRYIFRAFLPGGQTGLRGWLMCLVMEDLLGGEAMPLETQTGQEYFDAWKELAQRTYGDNDDDYMQTHAPKSWMLLQMIGE